LPFSAPRGSFLPSTIHPQPSTISPARGRADADIPGEPLQSGRDLIAAGFRSPDQKDRESIHFHELVHIIQWDELGAEKFILTYGINLLASGYRQHPLEAIAYDLQAEFDQGRPIPGLESRVRSQCRELAANLNV